MATKTNAQQAKEAKEELVATNEAIAKAKEELEATNKAKDAANAELADIDEQIDEANTTLDDTKDELDASEKAKLEKEANQPSADKYEAKAKAFSKKGKNGKPLIGKGTGYEITLNK